MRNRNTAVVAVILAAAAAGTIGGVTLFGGPEDPPPPESTTLAATASTTTTTDTTAPATTAITTTTAPPATTTTTSRPRMTLTFTGGQSSPHLEPIVTGFYRWLVDRSADEPDIPDGLAAHIGGVESNLAFHLTAEIYKDQLADGKKVAVVLVGDDVILAAAEGSGWKIVGAKLAGFGLDPWYGDPVRHVFIIGTDARPGQDQPGFRADSLHIVAASLPERGGAVVGIPRDTYVAASYGSDKYSSVNVRGSTEEMVEIAEDLSGLSIEGYILTGFAGFKRLINKFGGIEVDIPFRMADDSSNAFLDAGLQVLKGGDALAFSRNRHITGGDFTRSFHQGILIQAGMGETQAMSVRRLPNLLSLLSEYSWTDLTAAQLLQLGSIAFELDPANVHNVVLPGRVATVRTTSVVLLTPGADTIFADLADGVLTTS